MFRCLDDGPVLPKNLINCKYAGIDLKNLYLKDDFFQGYDDVVNYQTIKLKDQWTIQLAINYWDHLQSNSYPE